MYSLCDGNVNCLLIIPFLPPLPFYRPPPHPPPPPSFKLGDTILALFPLSSQVLALVLECSFPIIRRSPFASLVYHPVSTSFFSLLPSSFCDSLPPENSRSRIHGSEYVQFFIGETVLILFLHLTDSLAGFCKPWVKNPFLSRVGSYFAIIFEFLVFLLRMPSDFACDLLLLWTLRFFSSPPVFSNLSLWCSLILDLFIHRRINLLCHFTFHQQRMRILPGFAVLIGF